VPLASVSEITPSLRFKYLDDILEDGRSPSTANTRLYALLGFLRFLAAEERPVCQRTDSRRALDQRVNYHRQRRWLEMMHLEGAISDSNGDV